MSSKESRKDDIISNNERNFILDAIKNNLRVDGRGLFDFRPLKITFGEEFGTVYVQVGRTR
jgi:exosome complex component RRP45